MSCGVRRAAFGQSLKHNMQRSITRVATVAPKLGARNSSGLPSSITTPLWKTTEKWALQPSIAKQHQQFFQKVRRQKLSKLEDHV